MANTNGPPSSLYGKVEAPEKKPTVYFTVLYGFNPKAPYEITSTCCVSQSCHQTQNANHAHAIMTVTFYETEV